MRARIHYRKLMLYHNFTNSDDNRKAANVLDAQRQMDRDGTWLGGIKKIMLEYEMEDTVKDDLKSTWKKKVKEKIRRKTEEILREKCTDKSKARTIIQGKYEIKEYLKETTISEAKIILTARLHMVKLPCNYKRNIDQNNCWLCGNENVRTEHFFICKGTKMMQKIWSAKAEDLLSTDRFALIRTSKFLEKVAELYKPKWELMYSKKAQKIDEEERELIENVPVDVKDA